MRLMLRACGPLFICAGALHFLRPKLYLRIMPPQLPAPELLVYLSGAAEAAGGAGLIFPRTRRPASWWLVATLIAIFPANLHMARHPELFPEVPGAGATLRARLPLQALLIAWVLSAGRPRRRLS